MRGSHAIGPLRRATVPVLDRVWNTSSTSHLAPLDPKQGRLIRELLFLIFDDRTTARRELCACQRLAAVAEKRLQFLDHHWRTLQVNLCPLLSAQLQVLDDVAPAQPAHPFLVIVSDDSGRAGLAHWHPVADHL